VAFDKDTDKAVLILPGGYGVSYEYNETKEMQVSTWGKSGTSSNSKSDNKLRKSAFNIEAVEDEAPLSSAKSQSQQMQDYIESITGEDEDVLDIVPLVPETEQNTPQQEIHPDLVVQFGDGVAYFGGRGEKTIPKDEEHGFSEEVRTFLWQMTRKKK
jgi:hypothetical protein